MATGCPLRAHLPADVRPAACARRRACAEPGRVAGSGVGSGVGGRPDDAGGAAPRACEQASAGEPGSRRGSRRRAGGAGAAYRERCRPMYPQLALALRLLVCTLAARAVSAAEGGASSLAASKVKGELFPTTNDTLFKEDLQASQLAQTFANKVARPLKAMVPRSYSARFVTAQMQMTGFFEPSALGPAERAIVRESLASAINVVLSRYIDERCCSSVNDVLLTNVCNSDGTGCVSLVLKSRPKDCGDGKNIDPEECDDGNKADGDGCSSTCKVERGFFCLNGNRFGKDTCFDINQTWGYRREDGYSANWPDQFAGVPDVIEHGRVLSNHSDAGPSTNPPGVRTGSRHLLQGYRGGSISVNLKIEYVKENANLGNKTMKPRHLLSALTHPEFLRRFQEQMRERDTPVVVSWSMEGEPKMDVYSGSPRMFYSQLIDGQDMMKCLDEVFEHADGTGCAYLDYVAGMTLFGFCIAGLVLLSCATFCCARFFPCCSWIGRPSFCKVGKQCGGALPTKRRSPNQIATATGFLFLGSCSVMGMTIVGFRCTQQVIFDIRRTIYAVEAAQNATTIFRESVSNSTTLLKINANQSLAKINLRLTGLPELKQLTLEANRSLEETRQMIKFTQDFIQGFRNITVVNSDGTTSLARNPCTFLDDFSQEPLDYDTGLMVWRIKSSQAESPTLNPEGFHDFLDGRPSYLPNGRNAPTCSQHQFFSSIYSSTEMSCPCCRDCLVFDYAIRDTLSSMPSMEDLENLNTPVPYEMVGDDIDALMREMDRSVQLVEDWLSDINYGLEGIKFGLRVIIAFMPGIHTMTWGTSWCGIFLVVYGWMRNRYRPLFMAFFLGVISSGMVLFPIVGIGAMAVIPMSDFCNGIPLTGADTSTFLTTFTTTGDIMEVNRSIMSIMTDCFTKPDGVLWNVVDLDRPRLLERLQRYDLSKKINPLFFELALNTDKRDLTYSFTNHIDSLSRMTSDNKIYGYDSMPYDTRPTSADYLAKHGDKRIYMFQRGGVIQGSSSAAMIRQINTILSSAMNEGQLVRSCNLRTDSVPAQDRWRELGGSGKLEDACLTGNKAMYADYLYGCCPGDRFWGGAREPSQVVFDYNIYKNELQRRINLMQQKASDAAFLIANIKRLSGTLERNLTLMTNDAVEAINLITDELMNIGTCTEFNKLYDNVRAPMCDHLSLSMDAFWVACFLAGCAWLPYFWVLGRNGKIIMLKNGLGERRPFRPPKKGGNSDKVVPVQGDMLSQL